MKINKPQNFRCKTKFQANGWLWQWKFCAIIFHFPSLSFPPFFTFLYALVNNFSQASLELEETLINVQSYFSTLQKQVLKIICFKARMNNCKYSACCLVHPRPQNLTRNSTRLISLLCMVAHCLDMHSRQWKASISQDKLFQLLTVTVTQFPP